VWERDRYSLAEICFDLARVFLQVGTMPLHPRTFFVSVVLERDRYSLEEICFDLARVFLQVSPCPLNPRKVETFLYPSMGNR